MRAAVPQIIATIIFVFMTSISAMAQSQARLDAMLVPWANAVLVLAEHGAIRSSRQRVAFVDYIGSEPVNKRNSVSIWEPAQEVGTADLAHVRTHRGVHLGMTIAQAAAALHIPLTRIHLRGRGHELSEYYRNNDIGASRFSGEIDFSNNRVVGFSVGQLAA